MQCSQKKSIQSVVLIDEQSVDLISSNNASTCKELEHYCRCSEETGDRVERENVEEHGACSQVNPLSVD